MTLPYRKEVTDMRKFPAWLILILAVVLLCGCATTPAVYTVTRDGIDYTVDTENGTVSDGQYLYTYVVSGSSSRYVTIITYPNGAQYSWTQSSNGGSGGWGDDYDPVTYTDGGILLDVLSASAPKEYNSNPLLGLLLIALGAWYAFAPYSAWFFSYGWRYKDAEPSDAALGISRIVGIAVIIFGVFTLFA